MSSTICNLTERVAVYQLLARLWAEEPGQLLEHLKTEPLAAAWRELGGNSSVHDSDDDQSSLDEDYCRLFVGPKGHLPPIQSVWMSGELDTVVTTSLREFDTVIGFEQPWEFAIISDHLGNELWAMSQILRKSEGLPAEEQVVADDLACEFFKGHLNWTDQLINAVVDRESDRFYGTIASITGKFLQDEASRFNISASPTAIQTRSDG